MLVATQGVNATRVADTSHPRDLSECRAKKSSKLPALPSHAQLLGHPQGFQRHLSLPWRVWSAAAELVKSHTITPLRCWGGCSHGLRKNKLCMPELCLWPAAQQVHASRSCTQLSNCSLASQLKAAPLPWDSLIMTTILHASCSGRKTGTVKSRSAVPKSTGITLNPLMLV